MLGDVPAATAILDCLPKGAEITGKTGRSYLLRNAQIASSTRNKAAPKTTEP